MSITASTTFYNNQDSRHKRVKQVVFFAALMAIMFFVAVESSRAGAGGLEFEEVWMTLRDWIQGTLGRIVAGAMILIGIIGGIARQSLMAFALGIGGGIGMYNAPDIIESIMSATLENAATATTAIQQLSNGLGM